MNGLIETLLKIVTFGIYQGKQAKEEADAKHKAESEEIHKEVQGGGDPR